MTTAKKLAIPAVGGNSLIIDAKKKSVQDQYAAVSARMMLAMISGITPQPVPRSSILNAPFPAKSASRTGSREKR